MVKYVAPLGHAGWFRVFLAVLQLNMRNSRASHILPSYEPLGAQAVLFEKGRVKHVRPPTCRALVVTPLVIVLIEGILGFGGIAGAAVGTAKVVFISGIAHLCSALSQLPPRC